MQQPTVTVAQAAVDTAAGGTYVPSWFVVSKFSWAVSAELACDTASTAALSTRAMTELHLATSEQCS